MENINDLSEKLCDILNQEYELFDKDLSICKEKKDYIIKNNTEELSRLTKEEQSIMYNMVDMESQREQITGSIANIISHEQQDLSITEIIEHIEDEKLKVKLSEARDNLQEVVKAIKEINQMNKQLIDKSLEYIDFTINLILGSGGQETYGAEGKTTALNSGVKAFDKKM